MALQKALSYKQVYSMFMVLNCMGGWGALGKNVYKGSLALVGEYKIYIDKRRLKSLYLEGMKNSLTT